LNHCKYIEQLLSKYKMADAKPGATPDNGEQLGPEHCPSMHSERRDMQQYPYRQLVGELLYLACTTRPDISHSVGCLSRFVENPGKKHWEAGKLILRYLAGTKQLGLTFNGYNNSSEQFNIEAYSDADWGNDLYGRKSIYGFHVAINGCPVAWTSKKQTFVAQSTCESEYVGMSEATREIRWISQLLGELGIKYSQPVLFADNDSASAIASNTRMDNRIKSIDIKYHYIKDEVAAKRIKLQGVPSEFNIADIFTKPLGRVRFRRLREPILGSTE